MSFSARSASILATRPRHHWYAMSCLAPLGRLDEALNEIKIAQSIDPVSSIVARDLAVVHFYRRDFEMALEQCDHTIELNPHFAPALLDARRDSGAAQGLRRVGGGVSARRPPVAADTAHARRPRPDVRIVRPRASRRSTCCRSWRRYAKERYVSPLEFAWIQFALGDIDLGFKWLAKASRRSCVRSDFDQGGSTIRCAEARPAGFAR
mgnify:CR=1 FL=1